MVEVPLTRGFVALVDDDDAHVLQWKWYAMSRPGKNTTYAARNKVINGKRTVVLLHRELLGSTASAAVDHRDGDGLNCRRSNLRHATVAQNGENRDKQRNNTSGFKGVYWNKQREKWQAKLCRDKRSKHLGLFSTPEEAARAYDIAARQSHGEFARLNFPQEAT